MAKMINVQAKPGLKIFFPLRIKAAPGRRNYILEGETVIAVDSEERFVMRCLRVGDLVVIKETRPKPATTKPAIRKIKTNPDASEK